MIFLPTSAFAHDVSKMINTKKWNKCDSDGMDQQIHLDDCVMNDAIDKKCKPLITFVNANQESMKYLGSLEIIWPDMGIWLAVVDTKSCCMSPSCIQMTVDNLDLCSHLCNCFLY